ncbi:7310_t:CDS:2 [Paraglomus brasilianum]|uniref:7310_t:CDS:1 n=1 Tax=Paraglomus brasilianum TaxID=144538 RepID=A0A9N9FC92_9GLOM|nr:7310_t:CDS:2 [Paraglomus brasilianum]
MSCRLQEVRAFLLLYMAIGISVSKTAILGHMRGTLFPQRQAKYVMKRVGVRKDHSKKNEPDPEEMKYLKFKNIKLLPGIKEVDCSPLRSHQLQVNLAVLNHLPDLVFKKISTATEENTRAISGSVTIQDVIDKLAQYGVKLERGNIIWPMGTDDITQSGEYRCVFAFPEFRMRIAKKIVVRGLKSKKPEKKTRVKLSKEV